MQTDLENQKKKKEDEKALKELRAKAAQKGPLGGAGLKKSSGIKIILKTSVCLISVFIRR
jgi:hypothetical protein